MENSIINEVLMHVDDNNMSRVFLPSTSINIFPCSRRGQATIGAKAEFYDPEARLNTERTNRIGSAINGFTESFIINEDFDANDTANNTLKFVLAGYRVEIKNFKPSDIANALGSTSKLYAHLSIHDKVLVNSVTLDVDNIEDYYTEILYRQPISSNEADALSLDVTYGTTTPISFFVGVSFTAENSIIDTIPAANSFRQLPSRDLLLFTKSDEDEWVLEQTSLLPKIEHDSTENSVKLRGNFAVDYGSANMPEIAFKVENSGITINRPVVSDLTVKQDDLDILKITKTSVNIGAQALNDGTPMTATTVVGDFEVQHVIDGQEYNQSSFKVSKDKVFLGPTSISDLEAGKLAVIDGSDEEIPTKFAVVETNNEWEAKFTVPTTINNTLTVTDESVLQGDLGVADNINVGDLENDDKKTANNGDSGYVVAKQDIIAKQKLIAGNDIIAGGSVTIDKNLTVGTENNTATGVIDAKKQVTAPELVATSSTSTPKLSVDSISTNRTGDALSIDSPTVIESTLEVTAGKTTLSKGLEVQEGLEVTSGTATLNGATTVKNNLTVTGKTTLNDELKVTKDKATVLGGTLDVSGKATFDGGLEVATGDTLLNKLTAENTELDNLIVTGASKTSDGNTLKVTGTTLLNGDFTVQHEVDGETQTSFKVTKDATILGPTGMSSLIVGEITKEDTFEDNTVKVKGQIETPTLKATTSVTTPELHVTAVDSTAQANIDNATVTGTFKVQNGKDDTVLVKQGAVTVNGSTTLYNGLGVNKGLNVATGDLTVTKGGLTVSTGHTQLKTVAVEGLTDSSLTNLKSLVVADEAATEGKAGQIKSNTLVTGAAEASSVTITGKGQVPALNLETQSNGSVRLCFNFGTPITVGE